jgi:deoxyribonucleoside regulator
VRYPFRNRVVSPPLDQLRRVTQVCAVVSGFDRGAATYAAIRGGLIETLIIDEGGAAALTARAK